MPRRCSGPSVFINKPQIPEIKGYQISQIKSAFLREFSIKKEGRDSFV